MARLIYGVGTKKTANLSRLAVVFCVLYSSSSGFVLRFSVVVPNSSP